MDEGQADTNHGQRNKEIQLTGPNLSGRDVTAAATAGDEGAVTAVAANDIAC